MSVNETTITTIKIECNMKLNIKMITLKMSNTLFGGVLFEQNISSF